MRTLIVFTLLILVLQTQAVTYTDTAYPADETSPGQLSWEFAVKPGQPTNATVSDERDDIRSSNVLVSDQFTGFSIPLGMIIDGIEVTVALDSSSSSESSINSVLVSLNNGSDPLLGPLLDANADTSSVDLADSADPTFGSPSALWSTIATPNQRRLALNNGHLAVRFRVQGKYTALAVTTSTTLSTFTGTTAQPSTTSIRRDANVYGGDTRQDDNSDDGLAADNESVWFVTVRAITVTVHAHQGTCASTGPWPSTNAGSTATIGCLAGYSGTRTRVCSPNAIWLPEQSSCSLINEYCTLLSSPNNGYITSGGCSDSRAITEVCGNFACNNGFVLIGSTSRTCQPGPTWSGSAASCALDTDFCPYLNDPANGYITTGSCSRSLGDTCSFACNAGYDLSGSSSRQCASSGFWDNSPATCSLSTTYCPSLPNPTNGDRSGACTRSLGGSCGVFSCNAGYTLSGSTSRTCSVTQLWNGSAASCSPTPDFCPPPPPPPPNGSLESCVRTVGGACIYSCNNGYQFSGTSALSCQSSGDWDTSPGSCVPITSYCPALTPPTNGDLPAYTRSVGSVVSPVTCNSGYIVSSGSVSRTCMPTASATGSWSGSDVVCAVDAAHCPPAPPAPPNAVLSSCTTGLNDECIYVCDNGYELSGSDRYTCGSSGSWEGTLGSCSLVADYCPALTAPSNGALGSCTRTLGGTCGTFSCDPGYALSGSASRTCAQATSSGGVWSGTDASCSLISSFCTTPVEPAFAYLSSCDTHIGGTCTSVCDDGYSTGGVTEVTCQADTAWSASLSDCSATSGYCATPPDPPNGAQPPCTGTIGSTCGPTSCDPGYDLVGDATRTCNAVNAAEGAYSGSQPSCLINTEFCPALPAPDNGFFSSCNRSVGAVCSFECRPGYLPSGTNDVTCQTSSAWSGSLGSCVLEPDYCPPHGALTDGSSPVCAGTLGELCSPFTCNPGFILSGSTERRCQADRSWDGSAPACVINGVYCDEGPPAPGNGTRLECSRIIGGLCDYACDYGYSLVGDSSLTCALGPTWSGPPPSCALTQDYCSPIPTTNMDTAPACSHALGLTCGPYACHPAYTLYGSPYVSCLVDDADAGEWSDIPPYCSKASPATTLVNSPVRVTATASDPVSWSFTVEVRSASNSTITNPNDIVGIHPVAAPYSLGTASLAVVDKSNPSYIRVSVTIRTAGTFSLNVALNGALIGASPYTLVVSPGAPAAVTSSAVGDGLAEDAFIYQDDTSFVHVTPRDAYGNPITFAVPPLNTPFAASLKSEFTVDPEVVYEPDASTQTTLAFSYVPPAGGLYVLSVTLGAVPISGSPWLVEVHAVCDEGAIATLPTGPCENCPASTYTDTASQSCTPCPTLTASPPASSSPLNCTCVASAWLAGAEPGSSCLPCPSAASCGGGTARPVANPGYFETEPGSATFVPCPRTRACLGNGLCAPGYTGYMCTVCRDGYFSNSASECEPCPSGSEGIFAVLFVVLTLVSAAVAVALALRTIRIVEAQTSVAGGKKGSAELIRLFRTNMVPATVSMSLVAFQVVSIFSDANYAWSAASRRTLRIFNIFNVDVDIFASECAMKSFHAKYALSIVLPALAIVATVVCLLALKFVGPRFYAPLALLSHASIRTLVDAVLFAVAPLLYIPVSRSSFVMFDCTRLADGNFVIDANPGVRCFDSTWWNLFPVGAAALLVYVFGLPTYFAVQLLRRRNVLFDPQITVRFGTLYRLYRKAYYWGEVANLIKRLIIVILAVFVSSRQLLQIGLMLIVLVGSLVLVANYRPYFFPLYNTVDMRLNAMLTVILCLGAASYAERRSSSDSDVIFAVILIAVILLVLVALHAIATDIWLIIKERRATYFAAADRQRRLGRAIETELKDVDASPDLLLAAEQFLNVLDDTIHARDVCAPASLDSFGSVALDTLSPLDHNPVFSPAHSLSSSSSSSVS